MTRVRTWSAVIYDYREKSPSAFVGYGASRWGAFEQARKLAADPHKRCLELWRACWEQHKPGKDAYVRKGDFALSIRAGRL